MERNITVLRLKTRSKLFGVMNIHGIRKTIVSFPHLFFGVPSLGFILRFPSTRRRYATAFARLMDCAKGLFREWETLAGRLALAAGALSPCCLSLEE
jgi:hypothetical protein